MAVMKKRFCSYVFFDIICAMRMLFAMIFFGLCFSGAVSNPLLVAHDFPKTAADYSFSERMAVLADGYADWDSEYDANGRCIKHCAFYGITIEEEEQMLQQATQEFQNLIDQVGDDFFVSPIQCKEERPIIVNSDFGRRDVNSGSKIHKGIDILVNKGTPVHAVADGRVIKVNRDSNSGNYIVIKHTLGDKEFFTKYLHLDSVTPGLALRHVKKGDIIARSGDTGIGGAHLDYRIEYKGFPVDPLNGGILPDFGNQTYKKIDQMGNRNFLNAPYCFEWNITSYRLKNKTEEELRSKFPQCMGRCNSVLSSSTCRAYK